MEEEECKQATPGHPAESLSQSLVWAIVGCDGLKSARGMLGKKDEVTIEGKVKVDPPDSS